MLRLAQSLNENPSSVTADELFQASRAELEQRTWPQSDRPYISPAEDRTGSPGKDCRSYESQPSSITWSLAAFTTANKVFIDVSSIKRFMGKDFSA
jgi:hypothetical protein